MEVDEFGASAGHALLRQHRESPTFEEWTGRDAGLDENAVQPDPTGFCYDSPDESTPHTAALVIGRNEEPIEVAVRFEIGESDR